MEGFDADVQVFIDGGGFDFKDFGNVADFHFFDVVHFDTFALPLGQLYADRRREYFFDMFGLSAACCVGG